MTKKAVQMSKYQQNIMHVKIMYGWTDRGHHQRPMTDHTFAPVDLTASKVAAGKNKLGESYIAWGSRAISILKAEFPTILYS